MSSSLRTETVAGGTVRFLASSDQPAAPVLVLLHAFPVGVRMWQDQMDAFPGWRMIAPAFPGFNGSSPASDTSIAAYAAVVLGLLDRLGVGRAVIGGLSMGGYVAFGILRAAPERVAGLILADTRSGADGDEARAGRRRMLDLIETAGPEGAVPAVAADMVPRLLGKTTRADRPDIVAGVEALVHAQTAGAIAAATRVLMTRPDSTALLPSIAVKTLIVVGDEDELTPPAEAERMQAAITGARLVRVRHAGHLSNVENAADFTAGVRAFLDELRT